MWPVSTKSGDGAMPSRPYSILWLPSVGALAALAAVAVDRERAGARDAAVERAVGRPPGRRCARVPQPMPTFGLAWSRMRPNGEPPEQRAALGVGAAVAAADVEHPAVVGDRDAVRLAAGGQAGPSAPALMIFVPL